MAVGSESTPPRYRCQESRTRFPLQGREPPRAIRSMRMLYPRRHMELPHGDRRRVPLSAKLADPDLAAQPRVAPILSRSIPKDGREGSFDCRLYLGNCWIRMSLRNCLGVEGFQLG